MSVTEQSYAVWWGLKDVLEHYDGHFKLGLRDQEKFELTEYLKSL